MTIERHDDDMVTVRRGDLRTAVWASRFTDNEQIDPEDHPPEFFTEGWLKRLEVIAECEAFILCRLG